MIRTSDEGRRNGGVGAVERALDVLEAFTPAEPALGLTALARRVSLPKPTVHRLLATLAARGYISANDGTYRLGTRVLDVSHALLTSLELRGVAHPHLVALRDLTGETVHLGVSEEREMVYLDKVDSAQPVRLHTWIGRRAGIHCTAIGKAVLAFQRPATIDALLAIAPLGRLTPRTLTTEADLRADLERIRHRGYAIDDEEATEGIRCVAAPVRDHAGRVLAAVGIAGPLQRVATERLPVLGEQVLQTAATISTELGFHPDRQDRTDG